MLKLTSRVVKTGAGTSKVYYITGTCPVTGDRIRRSTRCHSRQDAEAVLIKFQNRQREKAKFGVEGVATFSEAVVEYLAKGGEARYLEPLQLVLGKMPLREITDQDLTRGAAKFYPDAKPSTVVRQWYVPFIAVYKAAVRARMAVPREWARPKVPKRKLPELPSDEWLYQILKACPRLEQRAALLYMSFSGARASEVVRIKCRDYNAEQGVVILTDTKTGVARTTALPLMVNNILNLLPRGNPDAPLFGYASRYSLVRILRRAADRAGLPYYGPHKVGRHSFAKRFLASGNTLRELMDGGGWASVQAVMLYAHLERRRVDEAMRSVETPLGRWIEDKTD
jgi:integrase